MKLLLVSLLLAISSLESEGKVPAAVRVGSIFLERESEIHDTFTLAIQSLKTQPFINQTEVQFDIQYANRNDYFHVYTRACLELKYGIVTYFGPSDPALDKQLESISTSLGIPLISTAPRTLAQTPGGSHHSHFGFSAENLVQKQELTLALFPSQEHLIRMVKDLAKKLEWKDVAVIHDPVNGIIDPSVLAESLQILGPISVHQVTTDLRATLVQLRLKGARNIVIDTGVSQLDRVIQATLDTGMMTKSYNYLFTMLDMEAGNWSRLAYSEALILGLNMIDHARLRDFQDRFAPSASRGPLPATAKIALTLDAVELLSRGLEEFDNSGTELSTPATDACASEAKWEVGEELRDVYSSVSFHGASGPISFANGGRSKLHINLLRLSFAPDLSPLFVRIGNWSEGMSYESDGLKMEEDFSLAGEKPSINKTLVITTTDSSFACFSSPNGQEEGYCADLAKELAKSVGFQYKFKLVSDGRYGRQDPITGVWDGMIGEVVRGEADLALADLTVTAARQSAVDFTTPFMQTSLVALYKAKECTLSDASTLLSPFSLWVWLALGLAFFITSICLRLVAWMSPYQKDDIILPGSDGSPSLGHDLSWINSMWLLSSTLVLRGCDIRLQAASSRTIALVWWIFSFVVIILYASLISHWLDSRNSPGSGHYQTVSQLLDDPSMQFGVLHGGSTSQFLLQAEKREEIQKLAWRLEKGSEKTFLSSPFEGIQEVKRSAGKFAFITEEIGVRAVLREDCSLRTVKGMDERMFAVAVAKGSPLREKLSEAILSLKESGLLYQLQEKWYPISSSACISSLGVEGGGEGLSQVKLVHFLGPLTILTVGIVVAICVALVERMLYHRRSHRGFFRTATSESGNGKIPMNGSGSGSSCAESADTEN